MSLPINDLPKGDPDTMEEAKDRASGSTWSLDSMQDNTIPFSLASFPDIILPVNNNSHATWLGTFRGIVNVPPIPGFIPSLTKLAPSLESADVILMSQNMETQKPAPTAGPLIAAIVGIERVVRPVK